MTATFFRCLCGKMHIGAGITSSSVCPKCGHSLFALVFGYSTEEEMTDERK